MLTALDTLTEINLDDLINAFGLHNHHPLARGLRGLFQKPAREFARQMLAFDQAIGTRGLAEAACLTERLYVRDVRVYGAERLPEGPCLMLSNHPGLTDTLALFTALARPGLRVIALDRPFLLSLPNLTKQLYFVTDEPNERASLVRRVHRHLKAGGSVLTFPAGHTEPDPGIYPGAVDSLRAWNESVGVFVRLAPETAVVPVCVRNVTWAAIAHHPLLHLRRSADDQQLLASALQLLSNVTLNTRPVTVSVQVGTPIRAGALGSTDTSVIQRAVADEMRCLIEEPPTGEGQSAL